MKQILLESMEKSRICKIFYRAILARTSKAFYIKPYRLFSHEDTVYLHAGLARKPGQPYKEPAFDPLLAVHRIQKAEPDERHFKFPEDLILKRSSTGTSA